MAHLLIELWGKDAVPIMDQEAVAVVRWDRVAQLLQDPSRRGMRRHIDVQEAAGGEFHDHQDIEETQGCRDRRSS